MCCVVFIFAKKASFVSKHGGSPHLFLPHTIMEYLWPFMTKLFSMNENFCYQFIFPIICIQQWLHNVNIPTYINTKNNSLWKYSGIFLKNFMLANNTSTINCICFLWLWLICEMMSFQANWQITHQYVMLLFLLGCHLLLSVVWPWNFFRKFTHFRRKMYQTTLSAARPRHLFSCCVF